MSDDEPPWGPDGPRIFDYLDYRVFIRDWLKFKNARPSMRALAERAHMSPALMSAILNGRRVLDSSRVGTLADKLKLEGEERDYFRYLVTWVHDGNAANRQEAFRQILTSRRYHKARTIDDDTYEVFSHWLLPAIVELASCRGWRDNPTWIADQFPEGVAAERVAEALVSLENLGCLVRDEEGRLVAAPGSWATPHEVQELVTSQALYDLHKTSLVRASERLDDVPHDERQYGVLTVALTRTQVAELKERLTRVMQEVLALSEATSEDTDGDESTEPPAPEPKDRVYHLGFQLYPLTGWLDEDEDRDEES